MTGLIWWQLQTTFTVVLLASIVFLACRFLKAWPAVQHALWVIVLLKFLLPPIVSWPWTLGDVVHFTATSPPTAVIRIRPVLAAGAGSASNDAALTADELPSRDDAGPSQESFWSGYFSGSTAAAIWSWTQTAVPILFGVWLFGATVTAVCNLRSIVRIRRVAIRSEPAPAHLKREVDHVASLLRTRPLPVYISRRVTSPFVCCFGRIRLLWPQGLCTDVASYRGVIAHELAHAKRKDHWIAWLDLLAGCIWWWNPLFWYVRRRVTETAEISCDALALHHRPDGRREYAEALLSLSQVVPQLAALTPALGARTAACHNLKRRLSMILNESVSGSRSRAGLVAACLLTLVALPAWSMRPSPASQAAEPAEPSAASQANEVVDLDTPRREPRGAQKPNENPQSYEAVISIEANRSVLSLLKPKLTADISFHALPELAFHAQLISISDLPRPTTNPKANRKEFDAVIRIEGSPELLTILKPGLTADISFHALPELAFHAQLISIFDVEEQPEPVARILVPGVQRELALKDKQKAQIDTAIEDLAVQDRKQIRQVVPTGEWRDLPSEQRLAVNLKVLEIQKQWPGKVRRALRDILTEQQLVRYRQIELQDRSDAEVFFEPDVIARLQLTDKQQQQIKAIVSEAIQTFGRAATDLLRQGLSLQERKVMVAELQHDIFGNARDEALKVLDDAQKKRWHTMLGTPFKGAGP